MTREVRFTETNGIRCWRCCPLPLVESGLCTCDCHRRPPYQRPCSARLNSTAADGHCSRIPAPGSTHCWQHGGKKRKKG
jgi:hypothetical protein